jgi:D-glycero-D-manno-heptose 1,7-bisphosphate phosphatase
MHEPRPSLVILDRDGVVNEDSPDFIKSPEEWNPIPGSLDAIARLSQAGFSVAIATNQSGLARGLIDASTLEAIHSMMTVEVAAAGGRLAGIFVCPHGPDDQCECRKPRPGLYRQIGEAFSCELVAVPVIGDSLRDLEAAVAVGARPMLVRTGKGERTLAAGGLPDSTEVHANLEAAARALLRENG